MSSSRSVLDIHPEPLAAKEDVPLHPQGRSRWFDEEVFAHDAQLRSHLRRAFPAVRDVEDVVQESYARIWKARTTHPIRSARAFLFKIANHLAIDWLRHDRVSPIEVLANLDSLAVIEDKASSADIAATDEEADLLGQAIARLPDRCREIFVLRKLRGLSQKQIAEQLQISESTVQGQIQRAMKRIEKFLRHRGVREVL